MPISCEQEARDILEEMQIENAQSMSAGELGILASLINDYRFLKAHNYIKDIINILNAYEGKNPLFSCQGQAMDGYSALANFVDIARKLRAITQFDNIPDEVNTQVEERHEQ